MKKPDWFSCLDDSKNPSYIGYSFYLLSEMRGKLIELILFAFFTLKQLYTLARMVDGKVPGRKLE